MEDKLKELTDKIYNEGVSKAKEETEKIIDSARLKAAEILSEANKQAASIVNDAKTEASDLSDNIKEEIKLASTQAINIVKQKIGDLITLSITEKPLKELVNDKQFIIKTVQQVMDQWVTDSNNKGMKLMLSDTMEQETTEVIVNKINELFGSKIKIEFSERLESGFRISPEGANYVISFTENDFSNFFSQFLRPKTARLLFGNDE